MQINFNCKVSSGLKVLDELIDGQIIEVQGLNGIGKSVAAQLLSILTGQFTFQRRADFESLKSALKEATISITNLENQCKSIEVILTPSSWQLNRDFQIDINTIGQYYIDGSKVPAENIYPLLKVSIIRGNDTILSQMREALIRNKEEINQFLISVQNNYNLFQNIRSKFFQASPDENLKTYLRSLEQLAQYKSDEQRHRQQLEENQKIISHLKPLVMKKEQIEQLEAANIPALKNRISEIQKGLRANSDEQSILVQEIESIREKVITQSESEKTRIDQVIKQISKYEREESDLRSQLSDLIKLIELPERSIELNELGKNLIQAQADNTVKIESLDTKWKEVRRSIELSDIGHSMIFRLLPAIDKGLGIYVIAEGKYGDSGSLKITVEELEKWIRNRLSELEQETSALPEKDYRDYAEKLSNQKIHIGQALTSVRNLGRKMQQISYLNNQLNILQSSINKEAADKLQELKNRLEGLRHDELVLRIELEERQSTYESLKEFPSLDVLVNEYHKDMEKLGFPREEDIRIKHRDYLDIFAASKINLESVEEKRIETENLLRALVIKLKEQLTVLESDEVLSYFTHGKDLRTDDDKITALKQAHINMNTLVDHSDWIKNRLIIISQTMDSMILQLRDKEPSVSVDENIMQVLRDIYNDYFIRIYQKPEYLQYVFKGFESIVKFDMESNSIVLKTSSGQDITRPLTVFSSGERAFAFSLAMVTITSERKAANRILILDEFGALLDYERSNVLKNHIKDYVLESKAAEKVILILPAREDLRERISDLKSKIATQKHNLPKLEEDLQLWEGFQRDLESKGYFQYVVM